jgi:hypothetical protein
VGETSVGSIWRTEILMMSQIERSRMALIKLGSGGESEVITKPPPPKLNVFLEYDRKMTFKHWPKESTQPSSVLA